MKTERFMEQKAKDMTIKELAMAIEIKYGSNKDIVSQQETIIPFKVGDIAKQINCDEDESPIVKITEIKGDNIWHIHKGDKCCYVSGYIIDGKPTFIHTAEKFEEKTLSDKAEYHGIIIRYFQGDVKNEHHVKKVNQFIKRDRLALKSTMKKFTKEENLRYGRDMGYISQEEYAEMKKDVNARSL